MRLFHRRVIEDLMENFGALGFKSLKYDKIIYKKLPNEISIEIYMSEFYGGVQIFSGIRFNNINNMFINAMREAEWSFPMIDGIQRSRIPLFLKRLNRYFEDEEMIQSMKKFDRDMFSPNKHDIKDPVIYSFKEITDDIKNEIDRLMLLADLEKSLHYACENNLFDYGGEYVIPSAARAVQNKELWDWSILYFSDLVDKRNKIVDPINFRNYGGFISALDRIYPQK